MADPTPTAQVPSRRPLVIGIAVAVLVVAVIVWLMSRGAADEPPPTVQPTVGASITSAAPTPTSTPSPSTTTDAPEPTPSQPTAGAREVTVPVYWAGREEHSMLRLYREFHRVNAVPASEGGRIAAALTYLLQEQPLDQDYTSLWPQGVRLLSASRNGDTATVDLSGFVSLGAAAEGAAVQQLVHTVTAADPRVKQVRLRVDGAPPPSGHSDLSQPVSRDRAIDTLANVWILEPRQGGEVSGLVRISVFGTGFEGNVPLQVYQESSLVASNFVTTAMGEFAEASVTISLPAGIYEVRAFNDSGQDDSLVLWDAKEFRVR